MYISVQLLLHYLAEDYICHRNDRLCQNEVCINEIAAAEQVLPYLLYSLEACCRSLLVGDNELAVLEYLSCLCSDALGYAGSADMGIEFCLLKILGSVCKSRCYAVCSVA